MMRQHLRCIAFLGLVGAAAACGPAGEAVDDQNPFLEDQSEGKEDTGYLNAAGVETEVTFEADVTAAQYRILDSPPYLAQFAVTYLRKRYELYIELLAEDQTAADRVEWLVDGAWISSSKASTVPASKLKRFRFPKVNAVMLNRTARDLKVGQVFVARIPTAPYEIMTQAKKTCADYNSHIELSQSTYWYLWNPDHTGCSASLQDATVKVETITAKNPTAYPEYDKLWADGRLDVVVVYGKLDDGDDIKQDYNWGNADRFVTWLKQAGLTEKTDEVEMGRRFSKTTAGRTTNVDVFYPDLFESVADYTNFPNWQKAVTEHEVVIYLGHSVLGTGYAYEKARYPQSYQIFVIGGCLGYEYYVRPVLAGKGSWASVDAVSSIVENGYNELNPSTAAFLAKLFYGFNNKGRASWQQIMSAINNKLGHSHFGVSGARDNCFTPSGNRC